MDSILVVEDEQLILGLVVEILEIYGYRVTPFLDADAAWGFISECKFSPRLLITDLRMPGQIDGVELVKRVKKSHPHTPIVVISGYHPSSDVLDNETVFWLEKPFHIDQLHTICQSLAPTPD